MAVSAVEENAGLFDDTDYIFVDNVSVRLLQRLDLRNTREVLVQT
jgi:hypothetical protein